MGIGDEIIGTRHIEDLIQLYHFPVRVTDKNGAARHHAVWENHPMIDKNWHCQKHTILHWSSRNRPYIDYTESNLYHYKFIESYKVKPGTIYLTDEEKQYAKYLGDYVLVEPTVKGLLQINKDWGFERWQDFVNMSDNIPFLQIVYSDTQRTLSNVKVLCTRNIREWLSYVYNALAVVTTDGAVHHAAAVFNVPAVVLFSGFISSNIMGYDLNNHTNMHGSHGTTESCGKRQFCSICHKNLTEILPSDVKNVLLKLPIKEAA